MQVIASADIAGRQKESQASKQATAILETIIRWQTADGRIAIMLCLMAPVGLPLLRALPPEVYIHKPFAERSSRQHDRPSQDRCAVVTRMAPDGLCNSSRACGVRLSSRITFSVRPAFRQSGRVRVDRLCLLLHAGTSWFCRQRMPVRG
jgi:hypothetical protein